jgi:dienelactone hydrolase
MKVTPLATDSQVTCVGCGTVLRIKGTGAAAPIPRPVAQSAPPSAPRAQPVLRPQPAPTAPAPNFAPLPQPQAAPAQRLAKKGIPKWVYAAVAVVLLVPIICCGGPLVMFSMRVNSGKPIPIAVTLKATVPPNPFPPLGTPEKTYPSGVKRYFVRVAANPDLPGHQMQMQVFVPSNASDDHSLPCVLIAPAGTPMIHGATLTANEDYDSETLPYAEAGFVVIHYSLDGGLPASAENADDESLTGIIGEAYPAFKASGAGVVNGRNALEYAMKLNMVDPKQVNCIGHSSAGSLSLLLAAHEPRIHRCVAFAAAYDLESRMGEMSSNFMMRTLLPGIQEFIIETSPANHVDTINCPVMIFHARDDSNVPFADAEAFVDKLKSAGKEVTFESTPNGDHYQSMINPGIPTAIKWLQQ